MPRVLLGLGLALVFSILCGAAAAQDLPPSLLADHVEINNSGQITASGNVQVFSGSIELRASAITYDSKTGKLTITGPISLREGSADAVILADEAALDSDLRNGLIRSARLVLAEQLQIAAAEIQYVDGRYTQLYRTVASSCQVCADRPVPLWQIRAERIIHDKEARQIFFEDATLELVGLPIFYLPRMRIPEPGVTRATGFLVPTVSSSSRLGTTVTLPYFVALGDHADITLAPVISSSAKGLKLRARRAWASGTVEANAAVASDDIGPGGLRAYLFADGQFDLPRDFDLAFKLQTASDASVLADYSYSGTTRLESEVSLSRSRATDQTSVALTFYRTISNAELSFADELPRLTFVGRHEVRPARELLGGNVSFSLDAVALERPSATDIAGRDMASVLGRAEWSRRDVLGDGIVWHNVAALGLGLDAVAQDSTQGSFSGRLMPAVATQISYPMFAASAGGWSQTLTPIARLSWRGLFGDEPPNETNAFGEFDEGNLFSLSRLSGPERAESGAEAAFGLRWSAVNAAGQSASLILGRVYRSEASAEFPVTSGLGGTNSAYLAAGQLDLTDRLTLSNRTLLNPDGSSPKSETQLDWDGNVFDGSASLLWIDADAAIGRTSPLFTLELGTEHDLGRNWQGSTEMTFDLNDGQPDRIGLGLGYKNECLGVDLSLSRRFTSSGNLQPNTDLSLQVALLGFGGGTPGPARKHCAEGL